MIQLNFSSIGYATLSHGCLCCFLTAGQVREGKLAFKSKAFGRFLSRGNAFPRFRFPIELFTTDSNMVGQHSCFEQQVTAVCSETPPT
jgi:hypothetical protein